MLNATWLAPKGDETTCVRRNVRRQVDRPDLSGLHRVSDEDGHIATPITRVVSNKFPLVKDLRRFLMGSLVDTLRGFKGGPHTLDIGLDLRVMVDCVLPPLFREDHFAAQIGLYAKQRLVGRFWRFRFG